MIEYYLNLFYFNFSLFSIVDLYCLYLSNTIPNIVYLFLILSLIHKHNYWLFL